MPEFCGFADPKQKSALSAIAAGYIEAALFSSGPFEFPPFAESDDDRTERNADFSDLAPETVSRMVKEAEEFEAENAASLDECGMDRERAGNVLWYVSAGHGVGWFDDDENDALTALDKATPRRYITSDLYVGDDGKIYLA